MGSWGGEDSQQGSGWRTDRRGSGWQTGWSHICMLIEWEEQQENERDHTTLGSSVEK